jgi:hypothetical protein
MQNNSDSMDREREEALELRRRTWQAGLSASEKARLSSQLGEAVRRLAWAGLRAVYPAADDEELNKRLFARCHGRALSIRMLAWDPEVHGW